MDMDYHLPVKDGRGDNKTDGISNYRRFLCECQGFSCFTSLVGSLSNSGLTMRSLHTILRNPVGFLMEMS